MLLYMDMELVLFIIDIEDQTLVFQLANNSSYLLKYLIGYLLHLIISGSENVRLMVWALGLMGVVLQLS